MENNKQQNENNENNEKNERRNKVLEEGKKVTKKKADQILKKIAKMAGALLKRVIFSPVGLIILAAIILLIFLGMFIKILNQDDADKLTADGKFSVTNILGVSDISNLVTINGTLESGYSLAFVDDVDEKLEKVIESDDRYKSAGITDVNILKKFIEAELVTQLPYLGGTVQSSKLPNLDGVDILYETEETSNLLNSMQGMLMLGDSFTVRLSMTGLLTPEDDGVIYRANAGKAAKYWLENFSELPDSVNGVCVLLGVNAPDDCGSMEKLIDKLTNKYEGRPIYVQKVFPLGRKYTGNVTQAAIDKYNKEVQNYCKNKKNVYWIDTTQGYVDKAGYLINTDDGLHISTKSGAHQTYVANIKAKILRNYGSSGTSKDSGELQGSTPEEACWAFLLEKGFSETAAAGIMGNWKQESQFISCNLQEGSNEKGGISDEEFTAMVKNGQISEDEFCLSSRFGLDELKYGYGLAQWTDPDRKRGLYDFAKEQGADIDDLKMQLDYFMKELENPDFSSILDADFNQLSVEDATVQFHAIFEKSKDKHDEVKNVRGGYANEIYNKYQGTVPSGTYSTSAAKNAISVTDRRVDENNKFQPAVKLKRVIPDKAFGEAVQADGKVIDLTYVPQGVFNAYINEQNSNVLEVFTINNNREVVIAKWSCNNGVTKFSKASAFGLDAVMGKYSMPYDYLMMLTIYGKDVDLCVQLAELAVDCEYIVAIQDEVKTSDIVTDIIRTGYYERMDLDLPEERRVWEKVQTELSYETVVENTETDSQKIELTYADSWAITVHNDITYRTEKSVPRKDLATSVSEPVTSTTSETVPTVGTAETLHHDHYAFGENMTIQEDSTAVTTSVVNEYESGKQHVDDEKGGEKFVELYNASQYFKLVEPEWLFEALNSNAKTAKLVDVTKYLLYKATKISYGIESPKVAFSEFYDNEFKNITKGSLKTSDGRLKGTIGWDFIRAWENNPLRKYMLDDGTYSYDSSPYIYTCVTNDRKKYILHDEIDKKEGNRIYGIEVMTYENKNGLGWQNVDFFKDKNIDIKAGEYTKYGESQIDVNIIEEISILKWQDLSEKVQRMLDVAEVEMEDYQKDCLIDILYDHGNVHDIVELYKEYALDEKEYKKREEFQGDRGQARWILFSEGRYTTPIAGEDLDPDDYVGSGNGGEILEVAQECFEWVCKHSYLTYGPTTIPPTDQIDCSGFVTWVLYSMGYTEFSSQWSTEKFIEKQEELKSKYGWEIIQIAAGEDISDIVQPGDIIDRSVGTGRYGHMNIAVSCEDGVLLAYDCGGQEDWQGNPDASPVRSGLLTNSRPGIIIRGVKAP